MPLTEQVEFQTALQRGNRVQVPKLVRWKFKLESNQVLKVAVWAGVISWKTFYACMDKSGRITIPRLTLQLLQARMRGETSLTGAVMEVRVERA